MANPELVEQASLGSDKDLRRFQEIEIPRINETDEATDEIYTFLTENQWIESVCAATVNNPETKSDIDEQSIEIGKKLGTRAVTPYYFKASVGRVPSSHRSGYELKLQSERKGIDGTTQGYYFGVDVWLDLEGIWHLDRRSRGFRLDVTPIEALKRFRPSDLEIPEGELAAMDILTVLKIGTKELRLNTSP